MRPWQALSSTTRLRGGVKLVALAIPSALGLTAAWAIHDHRGVPFVGHRTQWSIGIYTGSSPDALYPPRSVRNPVMTAAHVRDVPADFVADPFLLHRDDTWYMFFEVLNRRTKQGDIGLATSRDGRRWRYERIVLDEPFHVSYPYVFEWEGAHYLLPESANADEVRLYRAESFPTTWTCVGTVLKGRYGDPSLLRHDGRWWLFVGDTVERRFDALRLFHAQDLLGPWTEHPRSPVVLNPNIARPGGRVGDFHGRLLRFTQDTAPTYGHHVRAFEILALTTTDYAERELDRNPIVIGDGAGWNKFQMHHVDPHPLGERRWLAAVDGFGDLLVFGAEY